MRSRLHRKMLRMHKTWPSMLAATVVLGTQNERAYLLSSQERWEEMFLFTELKLAIFKSLLQ